MNERPHSPAACALSAGHQLHAPSRLQALLSLSCWGGEWIMGRSKREASRAPALLRFPRPQQTRTTDRPKKKIPAWSSAAHDTFPRVLTLPSTSQNPWRPPHGRAKTLGPPMSRRPPRPLLLLLRRFHPSAHHPSAPSSSTSRPFPPLSPDAIPSSSTHSAASDDSSSSPSSSTSSRSSTPPPPPPDKTSHLRAAVSKLAAALLALPATSPPPDPTPVLLSHSFPTLVALSPLCSLHLLSLLRPNPHLALAVFSFRRSLSPPPTLPEFSLTISLAGHAREPSAAAALFAAATTSYSPDLCMYNALMAAYMHNGLADRCAEVFEALRRDARSGPPNVDSYNILLALFGRLLLVDHMEATLHALDASGLPRTAATYNALISGYLTAWMWDRMEAVFLEMVASPVVPDATTYLLMLRGYAHAGMIDKMELAYGRAREYGREVNAVYIRAMLCAYCKFPHPGRIQRIEEMLGKLSAEDYRSWLSVLLINVYAREGLVDRMEQEIADALEHNVTVNTVRVMRSIISSYFVCDAVDKLAQFVQLAEEAGWKLCRSLYHCKMVMYGKHCRLAEMHGVLDEMKNFRFDWTKNTFCIMHKAYVGCGRTAEAHAVLGMMWKHGFGGS